MTPPERASVALPPGGSAPQSVAQAGAAITEHHAAPAPPLTAGAVDPDTAPAVSEAHGGSGAPDVSAAPAVTHGWAAALTGQKAHWVPAGAPRDVHYGRPTGLALEGWYALIDAQGLAEGAQLPPCRTCCRELARLSAPSEPKRP